MATLLRIAALIPVVADDVSLLHPSGGPGAAPRTVFEELTTMPTLTRPQRRCPNLPGPWAPASSLPAGERAGNDPSGPHTKRSHRRRPRRLFLP